MAFSRFHFFIVAAALFLALLAFWRFQPTTNQFVVKQPVTNRLLNSASPYLQQHASNPIDWYPWGEEAFAKAKRENKPIFLSVGYSTCHWCHVMEEESFSQKDIGALLNKYFVAIKVDRERRPDLDEIYMMATQIVTGTGGWPNNLFLTPDKKPFFAGGYFPKDQFSKLLSEVNGQWRSQNKAELLKDGDKIYGLIQKVMNRQEQAQKLDKTAIQKAAKRLLRSFDPFYGGFSIAPKFPEEPKLMFLSRVALQYGDKEALQAVTETVDAVLNGGIHDHVGGGFHRYAIDNAWLVPHFEKMLYNQAQMVRVLLRLYQMTGDRRYRRAVERCLNFVERDMTSPEGGFYSAYDADSQGGEGRYYTWTLEEVRAALPVETAAFVIEAFGMSEGGNFEGANILHFPVRYKEQLKKFKISGVTFDRRLDKLVAMLLKARDKRTKPHLDKKIIVSWNGMMITAFSEAARILNNEHYRHVGEKALAFIEKNMTTQQGRSAILQRSWYQGKADLAGQLADYAALSVGALALSDNPNSFAAGNRWQKLAKSYLVTVDRLFLDKAQGDYFMTQKVGAQMGLKKRDDSAVPSGNASMLEALVMMAQRSNGFLVKEKVDRLVASLSGVLLKNPSSSPFALYGAMLHQNGFEKGLAYGARGHVRVMVQQGGYDRGAKMNAESQEGDLDDYAVKILIEEGWHINSHKPLEDYFIATTLIVESDLKAKDKVKVIYPKPIVRKLGFHKKEMSVYEGKVVLSGSGISRKKRFSLTLKYQACSNKICLEPEMVDLGGFFQRSR